MNKKICLLRECIGCCLIFIFFLSIYVLSKNFNPALIVLFIFFAIFSYLIVAKYFLKKVGIKKFRDIFNREVLEKYDKKMRKEISYVLIYGLLCVLLVLAYVIILTSLIVPVSKISTSLGITIFVLTCVIMLFLVIILTIGIGFIRKLPKCIGKRKYVIPFSVLLKWFVVGFLGAVIIGAFCVIMGIPLVFLFEKIGLKKPTFFLVGIFIPSFFGLYTKFINKFSLPIICWIKENVRCPKCGEEVNKISMSISRFHLIELTIQCQNCNKRFKLGTGPLGRTLCIYS